MCALASCTAIKWVTMSISPAKSNTGERATLSLIIINIAKGTTDPDVDVALTNLHILQSLQILNILRILHILHILHIFHVLHILHIPYIMHSIHSLHSLHGLHSLQSLHNLGQFIQSSTRSLVS